MHAVHRSYDTALKNIELGFLAPTLKQLLSDMQAALAAGSDVDLPAEVRADVDLYLTVARQLLGDTAAPVAGANTGEIALLVSSAWTATDGLQARFVVRRDALRRLLAVQTARALCR